MSAADVGADRARLTEVTIMTMTPAQLQKQNALKLLNKMKQGGVAALPGAAPVVDRRAQRKADQALGLVPFAVKLNSDLIKQIHTQAEARQLSVQEVVAELLTAGLAAN